MPSSTSFTYDELIAALGDWLEESSQEFIDNQETIVSMGESRLTTDLNFEIFDRVVTGSLIPDQYVQAIKPSDWQGTRSLHLRDVGGPADVALLVDADGADGATTYTERSSNAFSATFVGDAQLDSAFPKFGSAALLLDGVGDYMEYADDPAFALGSGDFTIEGWVRFASLPAVGDEMTMVSQWSIGTGSDQAFAISLIQDGGDYRIRFEAEDTVGVFEQGGLGGAPALGTYIHFAAQRSGDTLSIWWDGTLEFEAGSTFSGAIQDSTETVKLGVFDPAGGGNAAFVDGHLDDVRISTIAQYATGGAITPPTSAFSTGSGATGPRRYLERRTYEWCLDYEPDETATAEPEYYAEYTETEFFMVPPPDTDYAFELRQIQVPDSLSPGNQTTWLGTNAGDLLLYACLLASDEFLISDPEDLGAWRQSYAELMPARKLELRRQWRGDYDPIKAAAQTMSIAG
jgi:prepilin-type processing-associated H-X9-DG protein